MEKELEQPQTQGVLGVEVVGGNEPAKEPDDDSKKCPSGLRPLHVVALALLCGLCLVLGGVAGALIARSAVQSNDGTPSPSTATATGSPPSGGSGNGNGNASDTGLVLSAKDRFPSGGVWNPLKYAVSPLSGGTEATAVALSGDGSILAVGGFVMEDVPGGSTYGRGVVQVYHRNEAGKDWWVPLGDPLEGFSGAGMNGFGNGMVALSERGNVLAAYGSPTIVYSLVGPSSWEPMGQELDAAPSFDNSLALSFDGNVVAVCSVSGDLTVYDYDAASRLWNAREPILDACRLKVSLAFSREGDVLAVGNEDYDGWVLSENGTNGENDMVQVYRYSDGGWKTLGDPIRGGGSAVQLSKDGSILAVGSGFYEGGLGLVQVFQYMPSSQEWQQLGQDLMGTVDKAQFGMLLALSKDGFVLAASAGTGALTKVFYYSGASWDETPQVESAMPNSLAISANGTMVATANTAMGATVFSYGYKV